MSAELAGFAFPFRVTGGGVARGRGFAKIEQNVRHLLGTRLGERPMLRTYGGGVHHRLQASHDATLRTLVQREIEDALRTYLPEARLTAPVQVFGQESELTIVLEYVADPRDVVRRLELQVP